MLGAAAGVAGVRCCDVLDCGAPTNPFGGRCITALATSVCEPLPEVRVDLAREHRGDVEAVWLVAAFLPELALVVLQLRPGTAGDRRRRTEPHWITGPELSVSVLGATRVDTPEGSLA